ncbi:hypothetical protein [Streptomyces sp. NPDC058579]|uniref:hypothetical protein n=1 Tax=Streptomyces sp. NPDC058579 TaxID=3346548 RepID=UPI00364A77DA
MRRSELPHLSHYWELSGRQGGEDQVVRVEGKVHVYENFPDYLLTSRYEGPYFSVRTPGLHDASGALVPCTPEECRRWVNAAVLHVRTVDTISAELRAAHARVVALPWRRPLALRRALDAWAETRGRYERVLAEAFVAYAPVGEEIRAAVRAEQERVAAEIRERERLRAKERARRARLAERAVWGWCVVDAEGAEGGRRTVHVFRHDVHSAELPARAREGDGAGVDLAGLRRALLDLNLPDVVWDRAALREARREAGVAFRNWWQELFYENYRTLTEPPPPPPSTSRWSTGGSGTSGSGGYSGGGFSCASGF